jgi:hypothetical protein
MARRVEGRDALQLRWDPDCFKDLRASLAAIKAHVARVRGIPVRRERPAVPRARATPLLMTSLGDPYVTRRHGSCDESVRRKVLTPLPESGIVDFTSAAFAWWRDQHKALSTTAST